MHLLLFQSIFGKFLVCVVEDVLCETVKHEYTIAKLNKENKHYPANELENLFPGCLGGSAS